MIFLSLGFLSADAMPDVGASREGEGQGVES